LVPTVVAGKPARREERRGIFMKASSRLRAARHLKDVIFTVIYKMGMAESSICKTQEANAREDR
jgi:hypothetical protein